jgi:hypothetical protein
VRELAPTCPACRVYGDAAKKGEEACQRCRVILLEENADAAKIYNICRGQIVSVGENIFDINHVALWQAIDRYKVRDPVRVFELVTKVFHEFLSRDRDAS